MIAPAVSVIIPCFNGGRFLDGLLASLAAQTFRDFEIIIVDDGSTEQETLSVLAKLPPSIRIVRQENLGLSGARNAGFREAKAEFVLPLDCDDALDPGYLAETVSALRRAPGDVGFVFTHMRLTGTLEGVMTRHFNRFDQLFHNRMPYCMLIRKRAWESVGGYDETMRDGYEDWEFNIRLAASGFAGIEIDKPLFIYRVSGEGMLLSKSSRMHATLWRQIREKYPDLYSLRGLMDVFRSSYPGGGLGGLLFAAPIFGLARVLPDAIANQLLFFSLWARRRLRRLTAMPRLPISYDRPVDNANETHVPGHDAILNGSHGAGVPTRMEKILSRLRLVISIGLIAAAFYLVSTEAFIAAVRRINMLMVSLAIVLFYLQVLIVSWRFRIALRLGGIRIDFVPALEATALSVVAGAVLLSPVVGMVLRVLVLRHANFPVRTLVLATLFERIVLLAVLIIAAIVSVVWLRIDILWIGSPSRVYWFVLAAGLFAAIVWLFAYRFGYVGHLLREWKETLAGIRSYITNIYGIAVVTLVTVASHVVFLAAAIAAAYANHIDLGIYDLSAAISATMLLASIPVAISGWGIREISLIWLLGNLGIDGSSTLAFSILVGVLSLLAAALASAMSLVIAIVRRRDEARI